jgi:cholesterol transport system auxiliary component
MIGVRYEFRAPLARLCLLFRNWCRTPLVPRVARVRGSFRNWCRTPLVPRAARVRRSFRKSCLTPFLVGAALLAGCTALTRQAPVRQTFLLEPRAPPVVAHSQSGTLRVGTINVAAPFRGKTFVYRVGDLRFESDYYVEFLVPPGTMIGEQTARALAQAAAFSRVAGPGAAGEAEWVLDGFVPALYADMREAGKPAAELDITYYLTPTAGAQETPVWTHDYRQRIAMRDATPVAYAEALNKAFGDIVAELAGDLAAAKLPKPQ